MRASLAIPMGAMLIDAPAPAQKADALPAALAPLEKASAGVTMDARFDLGVVHPNGREVPKDENQTLALLKIASAADQRSQ